jgi:hypothetical protein
MSNLKIRAFLRQKRFPTLLDGIDIPDRYSEWYRNMQKDPLKFVTPTLAEIYRAQGQYFKALAIWDILCARSPNNEWYKHMLTSCKEQYMNMPKDPV